MLKKGDLLNIGYYDYGQYVTGSLDGLRFMLGRDPLEKVCRTSDGGELYKSLRIQFGAI